MDRRAALAMTIREEACHCERSAAIHDCACSAMDRRAALAMTNRGDACHCERSAAIHDCACSAMDRRAAHAMTNRGAVAMKAARTGSERHMNREPVQSLSVIANEVRQSMTAPVRRCACDDESGGRFME